MSLDLRLLGETRFTLPHIDWEVLGRRYLPIALVIVIPAILLDFRSEFDYNDSVMEVISIFVLATAILFGLMLQTQVTQAEDRQRRIRQCWDQEIAHISSLMIDLEVMCKKQANCRVLGFELIQDILASSRSDAFVAVPFTEHVDFSSKLQNLIDEWLTRADNDVSTRSWKHLHGQMINNFLEHIHAVVEVRFLRISSKNDQITNWNWFHLCIMAGLLFWSTLQLKGSFSPFNTTIPILMAAVIIMLLIYIDYIDRTEISDDGGMMMLAQLEEHAQHRILASVSSSHLSQRLQQPMEPPTVTVSHLDNFPQRHTFASITSSLEMDQQSVASSNFTTTLEETKHAL